jgi:glycosyltransferase involved in cell wall biosynthesis
MKILFIADGRSPTAQNWIHYFVDLGAEVHLASMFPCRLDFNLASITLIPVLFLGASDPIQGSDSRTEGVKARLLRNIATPGVRTWLRHQLVPNSLSRSAPKLRSLILGLQPDIIHAMRIPYEGMLTALVQNSLPQPRTPTIISVWGNDFTLHAPATRRMSRLTLLAMKTADGLHTDCHRDQAFGFSWGFDIGKPAIVLPGAGGIQRNIFCPSETNPQPVVINPRGVRTYVRNDTFFRAIPLVLARQPQTRFVCPAMENQSEIGRWVNSLGIQQAVDLLSRQSRSEMANLYRQAQVVVSPSTHDGTPNTLLEAMACGCFPVAGDIESVREWITPGTNGLLVDPSDPQDLADAICEGLQNSELRTRSYVINQTLVQDRAEYSMVMKKATQFYHQLMAKSSVS